MSPIVDYTSSPLRNEGAGAQITALAIGYPHFFHRMKRHDIPSLDLFVWDVLKGDTSRLRNVFNLLRLRAYQLWWSIPQEIVFPAQGWPKGAFNGFPPDRGYRLYYLFPKEARITWSQFHLSTSIVPTQTYILCFSYGTCFVAHMPGEYFMSQMVEHLAGTTLPAIHKPALVAARSALNIGHEPKVVISGDVRLYIPVCEATRCPAKGHYTIATEGLPGPLHVIWMVDGQVLSHSHYEIDIGFDMQGKAVGETLTRQLSVHVTAQGGCGPIVHSSVFIQVVVIPGDEKGANEG